MEKDVDVGSLGNINAIFHASIVTIIIVVNKQISWLTDHDIDHNRNSLKTTDNDNRNTIKR